MTDGKIDIDKVIDTDIEETNPLISAGLMKRYQSSARVTDRAKLRS